MKRFVQEYLLENWNLKITAVLLSLILWLFVRGEPVQEKFVSGVPIEVRVPAHMEITKERPTSVDVTMIAATFSDILLGLPHPTCLIDLQEAKEGEHNITLTSENIKMPRGSGIEVVKVNPSRVTLVLERTLSKEVPIVVPVRGDPSRGYEIYGRSSKPSTVIITGPRSLVNPVTEVPTETVTISELKQPSRFFVGLNVKDKTIRPSISSPLQVDIDIGPRRRVATIEDVPVIINDPAYGISPQSVAVQVFAPADSIPDLGPSDFSACVSAAGLDPSKTPVRVKPQVRIVSNPHGAMVIKDVNPAEVTIVHRKQKPEPRRK
jgi:YbbR domain-containing protein